MRTSTVLRYFRGDRAALAKALGIRRESTYDWGRDVPPLRAYELERLTGGVLRVRGAPKPLDDADKEEGTG